MRRLSLLAPLCVILIAATAQAQPVVHLSSNTINFSPTLVGGQSMLPLTIQNTGDQQLDVSDVILTGDVFATDFGGAFSIAPGAQSDLTLTFAPAAVGAYQETLTISSNDPATPEAVVTLRGAGVEPDISVGPLSLDFGVLAAGQTRELPVTITNVGFADLTITDTWIDGLYYTDFSDLFVLAPNESRDISVQFNPDRPGEFTGTFNISSDDPDEDLVQIPLRGVVNGDIHFAGGLVTAGGAVRAVVAGNYAYVADQASGLEIIDISDPANPSLTGAFDTDGTAYDVAISGNYAYVADGVGLRILDVSDPAHPSSVGFYDSPGIAYGVAIAGNFAYLADGLSGLQIVNISNPASPSRTGTYNTPGESRDVAVSGSYAYVADKTRGLQIININNPANPTRSGFYDTPGESYDVAVAGSDAYVADGTQGLCVVSVGNPAAPSRIGSALQGGTTYGVDLASGRVFLSTDGIGLKVFDVSTPSSPTQIASFATIALGGRDVSLAGNFAYVADAAGGLRILDIADVLQHPNIDVVMADTDFGTIKVGESDTLGLNISNIGDYPLNLTDMFITGDYYTSNFDGAVEIAPGASRHYIITFAPGAVGAHYATLAIASDDPDEAVVNIELSGAGEMNHAPEVVHQIADLTVNEDAGETIVADLDTVFTDTDGEALTFSISGAPASVNMSIGAGNILSFYSNQNFNLPDGVQITVTASDPRDGSVSDQFTLVITPVNDPPQVALPIDDVTVDEDSGLNIAAFLGETFGDVDGDALTYTYTGAPAQLRMSTRLFMGERILYFESDLNYNLPDGADITVTATDPSGASVSDVFRVVVNPVNDAPTVLHAISDQTVNEDCGTVTIGDLDNVFNDVDLEQLTYEVAGRAELDLQIGEGNVLSFTPDADFNIAAGAAITVTARDGFDVTATDEFIIRVNPINDTPRIATAIADVTVDEDPGFVFVANLTMSTFTDVDSDPLTFSITGAPEGLNMSLNSYGYGFGQVGYDLVFNPDLNYNLPDGADITITAQDTSGASISDQFHLVVTPVNDPPYADRRQLFQVAVDEDPGFTVVTDLDQVFTDPEGDLLTYTVTGAPAEAHFAIDGENVLSLDPEPNFNINSVMMSVTAEDPSGLTCTHRFELRIFAVNDLPTVVSPISDQTIDEDAGITFVADLDEVFHDADGDALAFTVVYAAVELGMAIDESHNLTIHPDADYVLNSGLVRIRATEIESEHRSVTLDFRVTVNPLNDAPVVENPVADVTVNEDCGLTVIADLDDVFDDVDQDALTFTFSGAPAELNLALDGENVLSFNPALNYNLPNGVEIVLTANDGNLTVEDRFILIVTPVNDAPIVIRAIEDQIFNEDAGNCFNQGLGWSVFEDPDGEMLYFSILEAPAGLNCRIVNNDAFSITLTPDFNLPEGGIVRILATDIGGLSVEDDFTVVVRPINDAPVVTNAVGTVTLQEDPGFVVIADLGEVFSDVDGDNLTFGFTGGDAALHLTLDEAGLLSVNPDADFNAEQGVVVTLTAEDPFGLNVSDQITIVIEPVNDAPTVVQSIADVVIEEDSAPVVIADLDNIFADPDGDALSFAFTGAPVGLNMYVNGSHVLSITPNPNFNIPDGTEITVTASDGGGLSVSDQFTITINPLNDAPFVNLPINDFAVNEDSPIVNIADLDNTFRDVDGDALSYTFSGAPDEFNMTITGENVLTFTPDMNFNIPAGAQIIVTASDEFVTVEETFIVTIIPVNDRPVTVNPIRDITVNEDCGLTVVADLDDVFSDPDGDALNFNVRGDPPGLNMNSLGMNDGNNVLSFNPDANFNLPDGAEISVWVGDGSLSTIITFNVTVTPVNDPPEVRQPIANVTVDEDPGMVVIADLDNVFYDLDRDALTFTFTGDPAGLNLSLNGDHVLSFNPAANYNLPDGAEIVVTASDGNLRVEDVLTVTINAVNDAPDLDFIADQTTEEGHSLTFSVSGSDPDGQVLTYSTSELPDGATFVDQEFYWTPGYNMAGTYYVTFTVSDGDLSDNQAVTITVSNTNRAPELAFIDDQSVAEGSPLSFGIAGSDPDGQALTYTISELPDGATFINQEFNWTPGYDMAGTYHVTFTVSDGDLSDDQSVAITVSNVNRMPDLDFIEDQTVAEGTELSFGVTGSDPDGQSLTYTTSELPNGAAFVDQEFNWTPGFSAEGTYHVTFTVSDGDLSDNQSMTITVSNTNRAPALAFIPDRTVAENELLSFDISGSDPDGQALTYSTSELPNGATFVDQEFNWTPGYDMAGTYHVTFTVSDGDLSDNQSVTITVSNTNRPPVFTQTIGQTVAEGSLLEFTLEASDPDNNSLTYASDNLPRGATLNGALFSWTPDYDQEDLYHIAFVVTDNGDPNLSGEMVVTILVNGTNRAPIITTIGDKSIAEGEALEFTVVATDPDNNGIVCATSELPNGATFADWNFNWTPGFNQAGSYTVTFTVTDNAHPSLSAEETITITVGNTNRAPVLDEVGDRSVTENAELAFGLTASDLDGNSLTFSAEGLPDGATLDGANFHWIPGFDQAGAHQVIFRVTDNGEPNLSDEEVVTITVTNVNRPPVLAEIGVQAGAEGQELVITPGANDPDGDGLTFTATDLPAGASFDGTNFVWTPGFGQAGTYDVTFRVVDDGIPALSDEETVTISVANINRAPVIYTIGDMSVWENDLLAFNVVATDPDNNGLVCTTSALPGGATFENWNFNWTPGFDQAGVYDVTFTVTDNGDPNLADEETITITVANVNRQPVLAEIDDQTIDEGVGLLVELSANDPDGNPITFAVTGAPVGANLDGANFTWTPTFEQAGDYQVVFTVSDNGTPALTDADTISITVQNINRAPIIVNPIEDMEFSEDCGEQLIADLNQVFVDPDGDPLTFTVSGEANLNLAVTEGDLLVIDPNLNYNGVSNVAVVASDGEGNGRMAMRVGFGTSQVAMEQSARLVRSLTNSTPLPGRDEETEGGFAITILPVNDAPVWTEIPTDPIETVNGELLTIDIAVNDVDGDQLTLACGREGLPEAAVFEDHGDGTGQLIWTPLLRDVGRYEISFNASDGVASISATVNLDITGDLHHFNNFVRTAVGHNLSTTAISLNGEPVPTSWEVGVFTPTGRLGGAMVWFDDGQPHEFIAWQSEGDNQQFTDGDALNFRVWDGSTRIEYSANASISEGPSVWTANATTVFSLELINVRSQQISFVEGWNLISLNITPDHSFWRGDEGPDIRLMTDNLRTNPNDPNSAHHIMLMKNQRGQFYTPSYDYSSIPYWSETEGYLIKMDAGVDASWSGAPIAPDAAIPIRSGWNIVAYYPTYNLTCTRPGFEAISSILDNVIIAKDGTGRFAVPSSNYSNMPPWREGRGYFINSTADATLQYPLAADGAAALLGEEKSQTSGPWTEPASTGSNMSVLLTGIAGVGLQNGDVVGAFNTNGELVGIGRASNGMTGVPVWGDDATTDAVEGMIEGEAIELRHWSCVSGKLTVLKVEVVETGAGLTYESDGFTALTVSPAVIIPDAYYLGGNFPNPFNGVTRMAFGLPEAARVSIRVFDVSGREVAILVANELQAGHHVVVWNAEQFNSGVYLVKMEAGSFSSAQKMMLVK